MPLKQRYSNINVLKALRLLMVSYAYDHTQCPITHCPDLTGKNKKNQFFDTLLFCMVSETKILTYKCAKGISIICGNTCLWPRPTPEPHNMLFLDHQIAWMGCVSGVGCGYRHVWPQIIEIPSAHLYVSILVSETIQKSKVSKNWFFLFLRVKSGQCVIGHWVWS